MTSRVSPAPALQGAASTLLMTLAGRGDVRLVEALRTRVSVHYETGLGALPVVCVATAGAVRLPASLLVDRLPRPGPLTGADVQVTRWWRPARPTGLQVPGPESLARLPRPAYDVLDPARLVGRGHGLTPEGDDVLAGALVTAHATGDPRLPRWRAATRLALATRRTTTVSRALLLQALEGYAVPQLADLLYALCHRADPGPATRRLLEVGHSSGAALLEGVVLTLTTRPDTARREGAA